jgi:hypothetical protein
VFIIFGSPRSGTTLLKEALCQNPRITIPHETDFIIPLAFIVDRVKDQKIGKRLISEMIVSTVAFSPSIGRFLTPQEVEEIIKKSHYSLGGILTELFKAIALKSNSSIAGDKSPNDIAFAGILRKTGLFDSGIKFIHIVRDVRDVILSLKKTSWAPGDIDTFFPRIWASSNLNIKQFTHYNPDSYFFMRFEDFVAEPQRYLKKLCDFLRVDFSQAMLNWAEMGSDLKQLDHHANLGRRPILERCYAWKLGSDEWDFSNLSKQAGEALIEFGYET